MIFEGIYRRFVPLKSGKAPLDVRLTHCESQAVGIIEQARYEMTRAGRRFHLGNSAAITGIAPVQALPTTAAQWALFNTDSARAYAFDEIGMYCTAGTPGVGGVLLGCLFQTPSQVGIASSPGAAVYSRSASSRASMMIAKSSVTITIPAAPTWYPLAENNSTNVGAFPGSGNFRSPQMEGALIIPPLWGLGLAVVALAGTTPLWAPFATWVEIESDLE